MNLTEEEAEARLNHENNYLADGRGSGLHKRGGEGSGRTPGAKGIPDKIRALAGFNAHFETAKSVSAEFGISPISAHMAKRSEGHPEAKRIIDEQLGLVRQDAITKMLIAMGVVTEEKIKALKPGKALMVAKDFATILDKATPKVVNVNQDAVKIMIYSPGMKEEKDYETIEIATGSL